MELIRHVVEKKKQVILLIPEISLTWQTVMRFYKRFGNRVSLLHSRMSPGERYDQYERARTGDIDIMIGPRSALFAPFERLGLIIIDEEHENAYQSELSPRYDARETAKERARINQASLILALPRLLWNPTQRRFWENISFLSSQDGQRPARHCLRRRS